MVKPWEKFSQKLYLGMALPAIILFSVFFIFPLIQGIGISLTDWNGFSRPHFVGFQNFVDFFKDKHALNDMRVTLIFVLVTPLLMNITGLFHALFLDSKMAGRNILRVIVYLPSIISALVMGYIWVLVLRRSGGAVHDIMTAIGLESYFKVWLTDPKQAVWVIVIVNVWQHAGGAMIIYLAGMQSIPQELYEVSKLDGATYFQNLWFITMPLLIPAIKINVIMNVIGSLAMFESVMALTQGGPGYATETLSIFIYRNTFGANTGYATAVALILFVITAIPTLILFRMLHARNVEM
jgi:raffinose/stachyose/melibiose transport system permease protein